MQYCVPDANDQIFDPAWHLYPGLVVLAASATYRTGSGTWASPAG